MQQTTATRHPISTLSVMLKGSLIHGRFVTSPIEVVSSDAAIVPSSSILDAASIVPVDFGKYSATGLVGTLEMSSVIKSEERNVIEREAVKRRQVGM